MPSMPPKLAALPRFDDRARPRDVPFERVLQFFDRVQPRFGAGHLGGRVAMHRQALAPSLPARAQPPARLLRRGRAPRADAPPATRFPARVRRDGARRRRRRFPVARRVRAPSRSSRSRRSASARRFSAWTRRSAFRAACSAARRLHLAQLREDRVQPRARLGQRRLARRALARAPRSISAPSGVKRSSRSASARVSDSRSCCDARRVFRRLRRLPFERFAPRQRGRVVGFDAGQLGAFRLGLRAQFFELQLVAVDARAQLRKARGQRGRVGRSQRSPFLAAFEFGAQRFAFGAARRAGAQVSENLEVANARARPCDSASRGGPVSSSSGMRCSSSAIRSLIRIAFCSVLFEPAHRFVLAREKLVDAGRFLEERAPIGRFAREDRVDLPLRDDRVRPRARDRYPSADRECRATALALRLMKYSLSPARYARRVISTSRKLDRKPSVGIVEEHRDFGEAERLAVIVAGEDDVFQFAAAQALGSTFRRAPSGTHRPDSICPNRSARRSP